MARPSLKFSLQFRLAMVLFVVIALSASAGGWVTQAFGSIAIGWLLVSLAGVFPALWLATRMFRPLGQMLRALTNMVANYREGIFSQSLVADRDDELGELMAAHNALATALRTQRAHLVQRELLLDTVMQNSPMALLLVDAHDHVTYANLAARRMLSEGRSLNGLLFSEVLGRSSAGLRQAAAAQGDSLFAAEVDGMEETYHLSQRAFVLQGQKYRLYLLKALTREISRQEVSTWKKLIRVLSHELNNSLGPLSSMAHSGAEIARRGNLAALPDVFAAIAERAQHLHAFVGSYAAFAKLPAPRSELVEWRGFVGDLARQVVFEPPDELPAAPGWFDRGQLEQALINLIKNAHEAGIADAPVELGVRYVGGAQRIEVRDRGSGMTQTVLAQALLPFYSTKRSGTGLGLALSREIAEAHGGRIHLANRDGGGLCVTLELPLPAAPST